MFALPSVMPNASLNGNVMGFSDTSLLVTCYEQIYFCRHLFRHLIKIQIFTNLNLNFKKLTYKMALASWLLLLKTTKHASYFLEILLSHHKKTEITPLLSHYKKTEITPLLSHYKKTEITPLLSHYKKPEITPLLSHYKKPEITPLLSHYKKTNYPTFMQISKVH